MKLTAQLYKELVKPKSPYADVMIDWTKYGDLVTFGPNMAEPVHRWFYYKQGFSRALVDRLLSDLHVEPPAQLLDPCCGVGTTLLAAKQRGLSCIGFDMLPLCTFVTNVKTRTKYDFGRLNSAIRRVTEATFSKPNIAYPDIKIVRRAFEAEVLQSILFFKEQIATEEDDYVREFLMLGLLCIIQDVGNAKRDGAFLRIVPRIPPPDVRQTLRRQYSLMISDLRQSTLAHFGDDNNHGRVETATKAYEGDARDLSSLATGSVDAAITSPPYLNRFDYTRIYSPELCLYFVSDFQSLRKIRYRTFRSHVEARLDKFVSLKSSELEATIEAISGREVNNLKIPDMIKGYFEDICLTLSEMKRVLQENGKIAMILGSAAWSGVPVNSDLITAQLSESLGLSVSEIRVANIRATSAQQGKRFGEVQLRESILMLSK